ncbi:MAG: hypothetical protein ACFB10_10005, partial [Salibacteraceae bacterium]
STSPQKSQFVSFGIAVLLLLIEVVKSVVFGQGFLSWPASLIAGFGGQLIVAMLLLLRQPSWRYALLVVLVISLTPWVDLSLFQLTFRLNQISIDLLALLLLILHWVFNPSMKKAFGIVPGDKTKANDSEDREAAQVKYYQSKYKSKSVRELRQIVASRDYTAAAKTAARQLLEPNAEPE